MNCDKKREISGLFEISMDEDDNLNNEMIAKSSKLKSKIASTKSKSTKRLKTSFKDDSNDDSMAYEFTPEKGLLVKKKKKKILINFFFFFFF
jgi:hypothetical protein